MALHIGVTQKTRESIDPDNKVFRTDMNKVISEIAQYRLIASNDTSHETQIDSETTRAIVSTAHADQLVLTFEIDVHVRVMNIHALTHPYAKYHKSDLAVHNIHLLIANVFHHWNKSIRN